MWIVTVGLVVFGLILIVSKYFTYWRQKNVPQKPVIEILLAFVNSLFPKKAFAETLVDWYNEYPKKRYTGIYPMGVPILMVRDPDLIKQITVKDFDHFTDHKSFFAAITDPILQRNLFTLRGQKWYKMRGTLSPSFTSSKMKQMFNLISNNAEVFVNHFSQKTDSKVIDLDMGDNIKRFANDVIASIGFGVKCDSLKDRNNEFYLRGEEVTSIFNGIINNIKLTLLMLLPRVAETLKIRMFRPQLESFFLQLVSRSIKMREEQNIVRSDMLHLLMQARKGIKDKDLGDNLPETGFATCKEHVEANIETKEILSVEDITGQVMIFLFGGFDTVSRSTCFAMYELAINPDMQQRLFEEIKETLSDCNGKITYEALMKMKYMDMVVSESVRLWPTAIIMDRVCVKPYTIEAEAGEEKLHLGVGDQIWLPTFALHRDPNIYQNPDKFDPERFNDENKGNINPYTFLSFGVGPRNCIGSRFALLEMKILIFHMLLKFELVPTEKTQVPLKLSREEIPLAGEMGFWIGLKSRN